MFTTVLTAKMKFPIEKEPYVEETGFFFIVMPNTSCSIICESGWNKVSQDRKNIRTLQS